jgi:hypothetical protein
MSNKDREILLAKLKDLTASKKAYEILIDEVMQQLYPNKINSIAVIEEDELPF